MSPAIERPMIISLISERVEAATFFTAKVVRRAGAVWQAWNTSWKRYTGVYSRDRLVLDISDYRRLSHTGIVSLS